jgi:RNA polymerase sigma factor (sigma-70 family)
MHSSEDARWFSESVLPYEPALRAYLSKRFPGLPDHDDLVQETYAKVLRARKDGRLVHARGFLFTAARNAAIDMFRRRRVAAHEPLGTVEENPELEEPTSFRDTIERKHQLVTLAEALAGLPERCRQVMMLRYLDGLPPRDIATRLGISPETVKVHLLKGVRDCTVFFERRGMFEGGPTERTTR